jgi:uncharacterized radical SAM protein YgiQ
MNTVSIDTTRSAPRNLFAYRKFWASRFGSAPFLPMSRAEMDELGWDSCDIILVTGDAYIDHPSFGMALIGRLLEAQGFRVGIISQPDWLSAKAFQVLGRPNLFFGVTAGNMDSMVNRYTADRKPRSDDAYTANAEPHRRPDHAVVVYAQRCREAFPGANVVIGSIEASLRRIAHYDYWSDKVRRSVLPDSKADLLIFGSAERAIVELAHRLAAGEKIADIRDLRGTAFMAPRGWLPGSDWAEIDSREVDTPGTLIRHPDPYAMTPESGKEALCASKSENSAASANPASAAESAGAAGQPRTQVIRMQFQLHQRMPKLERTRTAIRLPSYEQVVADPVLYAHASRTFHVESNPGNARALIQGHGERDLWLNPPPIPLSTPEMDGVFASPFQRRPHPAYGDAKIPAFEMIRFSINIMRGCFGGCTFCSITEHEGRIIQSRSEESILHEIEEIRDKTPGFTGIISDLGGPTANMYRLACKDAKIESSCRRLSCVFPGICENLNTDHTPLVNLYRKARAVPGVKKVLISSGLRYDLAVRDPQYVKELVSHHVGGYLKIAPEHTEDGPLGAHDEAGHGLLRAVQGDVREILERGRKAAIPDSVLHRRASGNHRPRHAEPGAVAEAQQVSPRPGADLPADADGHCHGDVPQREEPAGQGGPGIGDRRNRSQRSPAPPAQGFSALSRRQQLALAARSAQADGARRPDWQRPPAADSELSAAGHRHAAPAAGVRRGENGPACAGTPAVSAVPAGARSRKR